MKARPALYNGTGGIMLYAVTLRGGLWGRVPRGAADRSPHGRRGYFYARAGVPAWLRLWPPAEPFQGGSMARITVEDCQERVDNRFLLVQMAIKRVHQYREGYEPLVESRNKEVVTALREIAAGRVLPDDLSLYNPLPEGQTVAGED